MAKVTDSSRTPCPVLLRINQAKWGMTHDEFVAVCRQVVREQDRREAAKATENPIMRSN